METVTDFLQAIPDGAWSILIAGVVSLLLQGIKKWLDVQSDKVITFLLTVLSFAGSAIEYFLSTASQNPTVLGQRTFIVVGGATVIYRYLIKPVSTMASDAKEYRKSLESTIDPAPTYAPPLPETTTDFSE